ncbi:glandular kallikrein, prostatic-like [Sabethes cyaneus]|uniref:glandular kallikrein, prostatic-like n=1 Tax=Sabethes cyaneus TaxID=53552 RepID=UPI00237D7B7C|nr:glandular kallikrein, prostatic-like [Sabethes cyaneus]
MVKAFTAFAQPNQASSIRFVGPSSESAPTNDGQRIINGTETTIEEYPFMASVRKSDGTFYCGGTILSRNWIMTSAACVSLNIRPTIQVGRTNISEEFDESVFQVERLIRHPNFTNSIYDSYTYDIALLKLERPLEFSESIQPVKLPKPYFEVDDADLGVTLVGWGEIEDGTLQDILRKVDYYVVPNEQCADIHSYKIFPTQICAAYPGGGKGQCNGDGGGPLLHHGIQVGIGSWSIKPCGIAPYPGVLTKVSHYLDFIYQHTDVEPPIDPPKEEQWLAEPIRSL